MRPFRLFSLLVCLIGTASAVEPPELLQHDIGPFRWTGPGGGTPILAGSGRLPSLEDRSAGTSYRDRERRISVRVTVSRYAEPTWVLHEFLSGLMERSLRRTVAASDQVVGEGDRRRLEYAQADPVGAGGVIAWPSGETTLVQIRFDISGAGREVDLPTQIIDAYLDLYPSSLSDSLAQTENCVEWIRDEMRRVLEYAPRDLQFAQGDSPPVLSPEFHREQVIRWLTEFAELRERFYGAGSANELKEELLRAQLIDINPDTQELDVNKYLDRLEAKLTEFQRWWAAHQNDPVQLPTPLATAAPPPAETPVPEPIPEPTP
jgi:hypothetical protein